MRCDACDGSGYVERAGARWPHWHEPAPCWECDGSGHVPDPIAKTCAVCGRHYTAHLFDMLQRCGCGIQHTDEGDLLLRQCRCGNTLALPVEEVDND